MLFIVWLSDPDTDITDEECQNDVSDAEDFGKDYFGIPALGDFFFGRSEKVVNDF
jgi:hypothetical protein